MSDTLRRVATFALCLGTLAACSNSSAEEQKQPGVVTFESGPTASAVAAADPDAGRPVLNLDLTPEEETALTVTYMQCLKDAGVPLKKVNGSWSYYNDEGKQMTNAPAVRKACSKKEPVRPPELDPDKNPYYQEDRKASIKCQIEHGIKWESSNGKYDYPPDIVDPRLLKIQRDCQRQFMNGKRG